MSDFATRARALRDAFMADIEVEDEQFEALRAQFDADDAAAPATDGDYGRLREAVEAEQALLRVELEKASQAVAEMRTMIQTYRQALDESLGSLGESGISLSASSVPLAARNGARPAESRGERLQEAPLIEDSDHLRPHNFSWRPTEPGESPLTPLAISHFVTDYAFLRELEETEHRRFGTPRFRQYEESVNHDAFILGQESETRIAASALRRLLTRQGWSTTVKLIFTIRVGDKNVLYWLD